MTGIEWGDKGAEYRPDRCDHAPDDGCMWCCQRCNTDTHWCPACGTVTDHKNTVCPECIGFPVVTICGSMKFYDRMIKLAGELTRDGIIVLMPHATKGETDAKTLDRMHRAKMDMSSAIYVVTNSANYVGESTQNEIAYAHSKDLLVNWDSGGTDSL